MSDKDRSQVDRREFLQTGAAATAAASALTLGAGSASGQDKAKGTLPTRKLGTKTGVDVTILNVGTGAWRSLGGASDRLLRLAYANGIRYIDTANAYQTEPAVARFFKAMPEAKKDTFVVTKDTPKSPKQLIEQLDKRLAVLEMDSVDAFFFHGLGDHHSADECIEFLKGKEFRETADAIKKSGKAKFFGFSVHHPKLAEMITTAAEANVVDMIMVKYNAFAAKDHPFNKALDAAHAKGIGLISMKQLAGSETMLNDMATKVPSLKDKGLAPYQMLLHAIWTDERISSCCVSMKTVEQVNEDSSAARTFEPLKAAELREIHEFFLASKPTMCALCDGRCAEAAGTSAALGDLTRFLTYHEHHGERSEARRLYAELPESARNWSDADLAAAQEACPSHLDFAELLPRADRNLA
ncbi:aldo/keto reductase [Tundrisphaera lichenicola]|uniref:aldo/keto reductase n=1 Tax=Tundrisphaera lichenicola TaxID=2029860 RepID=UPI003EB85789